MRHRPLRGTLLTRGNPPDPPARGRPVRGNPSNRAVTAAADAPILWCGGASVEGDDLAAPLSVGEGGDRVVEFVELDSAADEALDVDQTGPPEVDEASHVVAQVGSAVQRTEDVLALEEQLEGAERHVVVRGSGADHDDVAASPGQLPRGTDGPALADHLEGVVETLAASDFELRLVQAVRRADVGRAEPPCLAVLALQRIHGQDLDRAS